MNYYHVDVFSEKALSGNGLTVIFPEKSLSDKMMLEITCELKQFESIFIFPQNDEGIFPAKIFTIDEELLFAGHPILGAGAVIHQLFFSDHLYTNIQIGLSNRNIKIQSIKSDVSYKVTMNQGKAVFINEVATSHHDEIAKALNITKDDLDTNFPVEVVSTGLPYLLVPLKSNIGKSKITHNNFEDFLSAFEAKFAYLFDTNTLECRTWDNNAHTEDVATGSAAGPLCAYLVKHKMKKPNEKIHLHQGRFVNRPSIIAGWVSQSDHDESVFITGNVSFFASGVIQI
ncbi:MAG: PhzF family phenazine biosynthesis protein [Treponema sp.]|jgi:PhzF family phenazine biosynthesis protein|nr:PhzF family phenazine biosynthesis protein [Treponema sp.]